MKKVYRACIILCLTIVISCLSCSPDEEIITKEIDTIVPLVADESAINPYTKLSNYAFTVPAEFIRNLSVRSLGDLLRDAEHDVSCHRLTYSIVYKEKKIAVSGLMTIPIGVEDPPLLSFQHGTLTSKASAPSLADYRNFLGFQTFPAIMFASYGYITFVPDYVGYGASAEYFHPYLMDEPIATAVVEMIKAGKTFLEDNNILFDQNKLFLAGFSEGGYATLAAQKKIESADEHGLIITASAPGGGTYDLAYTFSLVIERKHYSSPSLLGFALTAYNDFYLKRPLTDIFQEPYASRVESLFNDNLSIEEADSQLNTSLDKLLTPSFLLEMQSDEASLKKQLTLNSVCNWKPRVPTRIWHGTADDISFYVNAERAYKKFIENGADPTIVTLVRVPGAGHAGRSWLRDTFTWLNSFK